jgi:hypothetical protein
MTARQAEPLSPEVVARVVKMLADMGKVALAAIEGPIPGVTEPQDARELLDPQIVIQITDVVVRPGPRNAHDPQRYELTYMQLGPLPTRTCQMWVTVPPGMTNPYEVGQVYDVVLRRRESAA